MRATKFASPQEKLILRRSALVGLAFGGLVQAGTFFLIHVVIIPKLQDYQNATAPAKLLLFGFLVMLVHIYIVSRLLQLIVSVLLRSVGAQPKCHESDSEETVVMLLDDDEEDNESAEQLLNETREAFSFRESSSPHSLEEAVERYVLKGTFLGILASCWIWLLAAEASAFVKNILILAVTVLIFCLGVGVSYLQRTMTTGVKVGPADMETKVLLLV